MDSYRWGTWLLILSGGLALAGEESPYEQTIKQMLGSLDKIAVTLKTIESEETANGAKPALRKEADLWIEARAKAAKLLMPERDEKARLTKLYKPKFEEVRKKLYTEFPRVQAIPGGREALKEISGVLKKNEK